MVLNGGIAGVFIFPARVVVHTAVAIYGESSGFVRSAVNPVATTKSKRIDSRHPSSVSVHLGENECVVLVIYPFLLSSCLVAGHL